MVKDKLAIHTGRLYFVISSFSNFFICITETKNIKKKKIETIEKLKYGTEKFKIFIFSKICIKKDVLRKSLCDTRKDCKTRKEFPILQIIIEDDSRRIVSLSTRILKLITSYTHTN